MRTQIITYSAPTSGRTVDLTPEQITMLQAAGKWLKDWRGEEFCQVSHGLHHGQPTYSDAYIRALCDDDLDSLIVQLGAAVGRAIAKDVLADDMPRRWTGLDAQDGDQLMAAGIMPDTPEWAAAEEAARIEYERIIQAEVAP